MKFSFILVYERKPDSPLTKQIKRVDCVYQNVHVRRNPNVFSTIWQIAEAHMIICIARRLSTVHVIMVEKM